MNYQIVDLGELIGSAKQIRTGGAEDKKELYNLNDLNHLDGTRFVIYMTAPLEEELKTYEDNKEDLVKKANGKYVLIKGRTIIDILESEKDALRIGIEKFGNAAFLVKKIEEVEQIQNYTSNLIKIGG